jgi:hypothetical protein
LTATLVQAIVTLGCASWCLDAHLKLTVTNLRFANMTDQTIELQTKRIVGVLASPEALQKVIDALELKGFDHAQFGVLAAKAEDHLSSASAAAADPLTPTEAPDDPESTGTITAAVVGGLTYLGAMTALGATVLTGGGLGLALVAMAAAGGVGGVSGLLVAAGFQHEHAESIDSQLSTGGLILWIKPRDPTQQALAVRAMQEAGATDVKDID